MSPYRWISLAFSYDDDVQKIVILARNSAKKVISDKLELENDPSGFSENDVFSWENNFFTQRPIFYLSMIAINRVFKS